MNVCIFSGYLLGKPELKGSPTGKYVCEARMNIPRDYKSQNGERLSDFITIVAWGKTAELLSGCEKGTRINITTHVRTELYTDKNGVKRESHKYEIDRFEYAERKGTQVVKNEANSGEVQINVPNGSETGTYIPDAYLNTSNDSGVSAGSGANGWGTMEDVENGEELPF